MTAIYILALWVCATQAAMELPKFNQMKLMYPGYFLHGGTYRDHQVADMIGGPQRTFLQNLHNTAAIRMSYTLNKYGGRHAIGTEPVFLSEQGQDSVPGTNGQQYIFRNTAFGPFLAGKYGNPRVVKPVRRDPASFMTSFRGHQGIVRLVSYKKRHAGGHVALWDCDHFYHSRDWSLENHIISVEFWETPDSYCAPEPLTAPPKPRLQRVNKSDFQLIPRHNLQDNEKIPDSRLANHPRTRHHHKTRHSQSETLWIQ